MTILDYTFTYNFHSRYTIKEIQWPKSNLREVACLELFRSDRIPAQLFPRGYLNKLSGSVGQGKQNRPLFGTKGASDPRLAASCRANTCVALRGRI